MDLHGVGTAEVFTRPHAAAHGFIVLFAGKADGKIIASALCGGANAQGGEYGVYNVLRGFHIAGGYRRRRTGA